MSNNSGSLLKPPFIIAAIVIVAIIGLSVTLRDRTNIAKVADSTDDANLEQLETGSTRISTISAPSTRLSDQGQDTALRAPGKKAAPRKQVVEDYDMAKRRAEGDSVITGRVFGELPESERTPESDEQRRERFRSMFAERFGGGNRAEEGNRNDGEGGRQRGFTTLGNTDGQTSGTNLLANSGDQSTSASSSSQFDWLGRFADDNKPLEAAEVLLYEADPNTTHPPLRTTVTDKEGSFTIAGVNGADQRYILVVKAEKFAPEATFITVTDVPREVFVRLEEGVSLRGKVVDKETSQPISGAVVYQPNSRFEASSALGVTTTSLNGEFYFPNTEPGRNLTMARADGYAITRARVRAPDENSIIEMEPGGASISGVTVDRLTGKPQGGARVWAKGSWNFEESVLSGDDGTFKLANLPAGEFDVFAVRGIKSEEQKIELDRGEIVDNVTITMPSELLVSGQVINAKDRSPLQGIKVWFQSTKGAQYRKTNTDGRFSFETMAIEEYTILIHEKGFIPVGDKRSTDSQETITRKVAKNQSSDELTIRLKPVPTLEGTVTGSGRSGRNGPVNDAEVRLGFEAGNDVIEMKTLSDPAGNFFFNLNNNERGRGVVVASANAGMDIKDVRAPRNNPVELKLQREFMSGEVMLIDESPLDGIRVDITRAISASRQDSNAAGRIKLSTINSMRGGRLMGALPRGTQVDLTFHMPDGATVTKDFQTNQLLNSRPIFVYDPVTQDIQADTTPRERNENWRRWGEGGGGGGRGRGNNPGQGNGNPPGGPPREAPTQTTTQ